MNSRYCNMQIASACVVAVLASQAIAAPFAFDDVEFWVGSGANRAAVAIDWVENSTEEPALVWGYRWDGIASGRDMLTAIVAADDRLFAKLGNTSVNPVRLYGLGYDTDDDSDFGVCSEFECAVFDDLGFAYSGEIYVAAAATDTADQYREGWATGTGFWHYSISTVPGTNPYDGGHWSDTNIGMATRQLVSGDWDSWAFQLSTTPPFTSYAENPAAAASPYPPGDFNHDSKVDDADYAIWKSDFGSTIAPAADANHNGIVDAADYTIWRNHLGSSSGASAAVATAVPEPTALGLTLCASLYSLLRKRKGQFS